MIVANYYTGKSPHSAPLRQKTMTKLEFCFLLFVLILRLKIKATLATKLVPTVQAGKL